MLATLLVLGLFPAVMAYAAASDLITMTISNWLALALVAGFALAAPLVGLPAAAIGLHAAAGVLVLAVTFAMFAAGWIGGGDAKLAAAIALWLGFGQLLDYALVASLLGGLLTTLLLTARRFALPVILLGESWAQRLHAPQTGVPYGIALAAAALIVYPHGVMMRALAG